MCWHRWSLWIYYEAKMGAFDKEIEKPFECIIRRKKRVCKKCGYLQDKVVKEK